METTPDIWFPHLGIEIQNLNRVAISVFGFNIYWYSLLIILGALAGFFVALREAKRTGQNPEHYYELFSLGIVAAIIGLRLFFVAFNWEMYRHDPIRIITGIRTGGLAIYGGLIAVTIAVYVIARVRKVDIWLMLDTAAPSFVLGQAIGRWGNFFNREAFGGFTDSIFAMRILPSQIRVFISPELWTQTVYARGAEYIQVHPAFLYESLWNFALFAALFFYRPRKKFDGEIFWMYLLGYGFARFFIEGIRTDQLLIGGTGIAISQVLSAVAFVVALVMIILMRRRYAD